LVSPATVFNHLRRRGVELRDKVDAQIVKVTKFQKSAFNGEEAERMYLIGFVWGDCSVELHGRAIRVRSSTTRPGFAQLFDDLFGRYGHVRMYPKRAQLVEAEWSVEVDLDRSFEFLLRKNLHELPRVPDDKECRLNFLAGLVDAEGAICWHLKSSPGFELQISNTSEDLLKIAKDCLVGQGYHPKLTRSKQKPGRLPTAVEGTLLRLVLYRQEEVSKMVCEFPVKHSEKKRKADVARAYFRSAELDSSNFPTGWIELKRELAVARSKFVQDAVSELAQKQLGITTR
ncbi:MAG TPA: LAGLIDADG family homing endonuclease, partial [Nitrososphaerales archaeon]|nr:LAGLIDADG family homing endonuclease [Nitrososphaerales archaeon]